MVSMIVFCALFAGVFAGNAVNDNLSGAGLGGDGLLAGAGIADTSSSFRRQDPLGQYSFGYDITDNVGANNGRRETGDIEGTKIGSYNIRDIDGRTRTVNYVADKDGFRAVIDTNEPGTVAHQAAAALYNGPNVLNVNHAQVLGAGLTKGLGHGKHH